MSRLGRILLFPESELAIARFVYPDSAAFSFGSLLSLGLVSGNSLLATPSWLGQGRFWVHRSLARRHLRLVGLLLCEFRPSCTEGSGYPVDAFSYNCSGERQVSWGLCLPVESRANASGERAGRGS